MLHYWGNIHAHNSYSYGNQDGTTTTPLQDFQFAAASLHSDLLGISEHNHSQAGMSLPNHALGLGQATTEAYPGCTREEQMRWLYQLWQVVNRLRSSSVDLRALTVWSLLGAYDWDNLLTQDGASYEPGVWDVRGPLPQPTALHALVQGLGQHGDYVHPVLAAPGWWQRDIRFDWSVKDV